MYGCEIWTIKKSKHGGIYAFELRCWKKTLENPLDSKEVQPVHPKGNQSWTFIGRTDVEAETFPILWPPNAKTFLRRSFLIGKDHDDGKDWRQEEKGLTEDEMVLWHHRLNGYQFESTLGVSDGQEGLVCCSTWSQSVRYNWAKELNWILVHQLYWMYHSDDQSW